MTPAPEREKIYNLETQFPIPDKERYLGISRRNREFWPLKYYPPEVSGDKASIRYWGSNEMGWYQVAEGATREVLQSQHPPLPLEVTSSRPQGELEELAFAKKVLAFFGIEIEDRSLLVVTKGEEKIIIKFKQFRKEARRRLENIEELEREDQEWEIEDETEPPAISRITQLAFVPFEVLKEAASEEIILKVKLQKDHCNYSSFFCLVGDKKGNIRIMVEDDFERLVEKGQAGEVRDFTVSLLNLRPPPLFRTKD